MGEGLDGQLANRLTSDLEAFREALPTPSYLGPFRVEPSHSMRVPSQTIRELGARGERALELLADDRLRRGGNLARQVSEWFARSLGQEITVDVTLDEPKVFVTDASSGFQVSLSDTGAGFSQVLPIIVQHFAYRTGRIKSPVLIVEQPELHLHPAAHGALADLVLESSLPDREWPPALCIAETHSEQFIMRLRRRIAEGLDPKSVDLLSINHKDSTEVGAQIDPVRQISFDEKGNPNSWPAGVFEETLVDLTAMRKSARDRLP
jgi:predicted ATPase